MMEGIEILKNKLFIFMILSLMLLSVSAVCAEDATSLNLNETNTATTNTILIQSNELVENTVSEEDIDFNMSNANEITNEPNTENTVYVDPINGNDKNNGSTWNNSVKTINTALTLVNDNGVIYLGEGEHTTPATINKNVTLIGQNQEKTILTNINGCFLTVTSNNVGIYNATFRNNKQAVSINGKEGKYYINNCSFINNTNNDGGAVYMNGGVFNITDSIFINNTNNNGAIYMINGILNINNSIFINNDTDYDGVGRSGGAICSYGTLNIDNSIFINNTATFGGAIYSGGNLNIDNSIFINNTASTSGGAVYMNDGVFNISDSIFINNTATHDDGGAISMRNGILNINNSVFENNRGYSGGAVYMNGGVFNISDSIFINNTATQNNGGAMYVDGLGNLTINNSVLVNNTASTSGGAVYICTGSFGNVNGNWWGSNAPDWSSLIHGTSVPNSFVVLDVSVNEISFNVYNVIANLYLNGTQTIADIPTRNVEFKCESEVITGKMINGTYNKTYALDMGDEKNITVAVDNEIQNITLIGKIITNITLNDIIMIYHDGTRLIAVLTDYMGKPIANSTIYFTINGVTYNRTTDNNGNASIALNLNSGEYDAFILFKGTKRYVESSKNITVTINSTIDACDVVKFYQNGTQFFATFIDSAGNVLANTNVTFNINGVFYTRQTNENGTAILNINLRPGYYILTAINPNSTEQKGFHIIVKSLIEADDLTKYFQNDSKFEAKIYNKDGSLAVNKTVTFNINGVFYTRTTNNEGVVSLAINLRPGNYAITTMYDGLVMGNAVKVLPTLLTADLKMVYHDGSKFQAKTVDGQGNPLANQTVTFNVNGVLYHKVTDNDGVASLNINLNPGEYIITSIWNNYQVGNKITIA